MRNDDGMTPAERELEATLAGLTPASTNVSRDQVMFSAGRASVRRRNHLWQGICSILAVLLLTSIVSRSRPTVLDRPDEAIAQQRPSVLPVNVSSIPIEPIDRQEAEAFRQYVRTRRAVLDRGVEALPASSAIGRTPVDPPLTREDLKNLLSST